YADGKINILFVGRLEPRKGAMYLMEAYAKLKKKHPEIRLILCSVGPLLGRLRRFVRANRIEDVLFAGRVDDADKARFYKTAQIFCAPSTGQESFGIVLLEAMAAGKPIVASAIPGYQEVVRQGQEALLVEPKDEHALALSLVHLLADRELRQRLGEAGRQRAARFS